MTDGKKPRKSEILGLILGVVIFATLTLPILHLTGLHDLLVNLSVHCAKAIFAFFGIQS